MGELAEEKFDENIGLRRQRCLVGPEICNSGEGPNKNGKMIGVLTCGFDLYFFFCSFAAFLATRS